MPCYVAEQMDRSLTGSWKQEDINPRKAIVILYLLGWIFGVLITWGNALLTAFKPLGGASALPVLPFQSHRAQRAILWTTLDIISVIIHVYDWYSEGCNVERYQRLGHLQIENCTWTHLLIVHTLTIRCRMMRLN